MLRIQIEEIPSEPLDAQKSSYETSVGSPRICDIDAKWIEHGELYDIKLLTPTSLEELQSLGYGGPAQTAAKALWFERLERVMEILSALRAELGM